MAKIKAMKLKAETAADPGLGVTAGVGAAV